jgi:aminomethyltransferase
MGKKTVLYQTHLQSGAKVVDFSGWDMPLHYGSQIEEHHKVRREAGMFDVSHMTVIDITGLQAREYLRYLLANDVDKLKFTGKALYTAMLNSTGGVIDDLIVYHRDKGYRLVVNCATTEKDLQWMQAQAASFDVALYERPQLSLIAVQGPQAVAKVTQLLAPELAEQVTGLKPFSSTENGEWMYCRTGYTGEDGLEIMVPEQFTVSFWQKLIASGVGPCGLGARDTLRLEAGMNLYGADMDESVSPLEANMAWTVAMQPAGRDFIGKAALNAQLEKGNLRQLTGILYPGKGVLRNHQKVVTPEGDGEITSGSYSPTLGFSIALARLPTGDFTAAKADLRGKEIEVSVVKPPFVRNGRAVFAVTAKKA